MSTSWNIKCLDCDETHHFDDNDQDGNMTSLIEHAAAIAALKPLMDKFPGNMALGFFCGFVDVDWFARHSGHQLSPTSGPGIGPPDVSSVFWLRPISARDGKPGGGQ